MRVDRALSAHELLLIKVEEVAVREAAVAHEDAATSKQLGDDNGRVTFLLSLVHDPAEDVALLRLGEEVNTLGEEDVQQLLRDGQPDLDAEVGPGVGQRITLLPVVRVPPKEVVGDEVDVVAMVAVVFDISAV